MNRLILIIIIFAITINSSFATTNCESYENRINALQELNAKGGTQKQLETRRRQIKKYEDERYNKCRHVQTIAIISNKPTINVKREKLRSVKSSAKNQNPQLQQLIKTCNYWIEQNNANPSWDNTNYRNTACRAADESENSTNDFTPENTRKLKDCIKPNNVIDDDVNACMKGVKDPYWHP